MSSLIRITSVALTALALTTQLASPAYAALNVGPRASLVPTPPENVTSGFYGSSVSMTDEWAFVGAPDMNNFRGAVYIFHREANGSWTASGELNGQASDDFFGTSVAVSGDLLVVGAPGRGFAAGGFYAYSRSGTSWIADNGGAAIVPAGLEQNDRFGESVALSGSTAVLGAPGDDAPTIANTGAAYVFLRSGAGTWGLDGSKVVAPLAPDSTYISEAAFGTTVAIEGINLLVGARNQISISRPEVATVHQYRRSAGPTWGTGTQLPPSAPTIPEEEFGFSIAMGGGWALVGAPGSDTSNGAVHVYEFVSNNWVPRQRIPSPNAAVPGALENRFGTAIAISGNRALIGSEGADGGHGAANLFERATTIFVSTSLGMGSPNPESSSYGRSLALSTNSLVIGDPTVDTTVAATVTVGAFTPVLGARGAFGLSLLIGVCSWFAIRRRRA